jgi:hypothetical protein
MNSTQPHSTKLTAYDFIDQHNKTASIEYAHIIVTSGLLQSNELQVMNIDSDNASTRAFGYKGLSNPKSKNAINILNF